MCDDCAKFFKGVSLNPSDLQHNAAECPILAAKFCSVCQIYGHSTLNCQDKAVWQTRRPEYIDQLLPKTIVEQYNIAPMTPIHLRVSCQSVPKIERELKDLKTNLRAKELMTRLGKDYICGFCGKSQTVSGCIDCNTVYCKQCSDQRIPVLEVPRGIDGKPDSKFIRATLSSFNLQVSNIKDNQKLLEHYGTLIGKKVVYIQNESGNEKKPAEEVIKKVPKTVIRIKNPKILS